MENLRSVPGELQCVGKLEIVKPKPVVGFVCGTLPVPTDEAFHAALVPSSSSSSSQNVRAPRYRMLPRETDLNMPPLPTTFSDKAFPIAAIPAKTSGDLHWESGPVCQNLARKCEALAVSGLAEYGDEIDVVAPADILKQIFKIPYSKTRVSVAVQRIGQTLVLNTGPDIEEGEKLVRRQNSHQAKGADQSIFLNFAMHSVRVEACDCPPTQHIPSEESSSTILPGHVESERPFVSSACPAESCKSQFFGHGVGGARKEAFNHNGEHSDDEQDGFFWGGKQKRQNNRHEAIKKTSQVGEKTRRPVQESDKHRRFSNDSFLRVLFWQFHNFRMLLGSDLLLFSNEKYVAVSLHLWDVTRKVTPLTWLEAWLDNVMASVPEMAICYHEKGVVRGYELLKTDDIFLLKGISEDGTTAFHPQVVQQNGLSVLRFLQDNCKQDPGAYWLYKSAGEDVIQLFDLSVLPKSHSSDDHDKGCSSLPSLMQKGRRDSLFSLGKLLYRLGHRLSLSKASNNRAKCARLFKKCLNFLDEPEHLVVRAYAHEQFARLILKCYEEEDLNSESILLESEVIITGVEDGASRFSQEISGSIIQDTLPSQAAEPISVTEDERKFQNSLSDEVALEANSRPPRSILTSRGIGPRELGGNMTGPNNKDDLAVCQVSATSSHVVQTVADPILSKLAAVHHVSQAIKSLGWKRQLQNTGGNHIDQGNKIQDRSSVNFSLCACGDADCIEVCDIREWLAKSKMDQKLWKLVLLLGESYLALGQAYKEDGQLHQALKVVEVACSVYGSMPQHLEDAQFISSMFSSPPPQLKFKNRGSKRISVLDSTNESDGRPTEDSLTIDGFSSNYLFWAKAWALVGDVFVEYHMVRGKGLIHQERSASVAEWKVSNEVAKEVKRLKKKLGQYKQNCSMCSLINCSCQSDRASSGNSASSSSGDASSVAYGRKQIKKSNIKNYRSSRFGIPESENELQKVDNANPPERTCLQNDKNGGVHSLTSKPTVDEHEVSCLDADSSSAQGTLEMQKMGSRVSVESDPQVQDAPDSKGGGIFKFLVGPKIGDTVYNLSSAIDCYAAAKKAISGLPIDSTELQSIVKRKGWACNELGRYRLDNRDLENAELAFVEAVKAFKEVSDHTNVILINCNLGHGRRALAEAMVSQMENHKKHGLFQNAYKQSLEIAKLEYSESLRYYGAALSELMALREGAGSASNNLWNEVNTQFAHTYLRLGMLLAKEDISAEVCENGNLEKLPIGHIQSSDQRLKKELRKREISANDAIREALCIYESLGELRKQEAAYAYFQLACYHRDCCLKFLDLDNKQIKSSRCESSLLQKVKQYASLAERSFQKSIDFYGPNTHTIMYLTILMERSALSSSLSSYFHSSMMMESALLHLLEGRHVTGEAGSDFSGSQQAEVEKKFWGQLQALLKKMLTTALSGNSSKSSAVTPVLPANKVGDAGKLRELYKMSLKSTYLSQLQDMYELWAL